MKCKIIVLIFFVCFYSSCIQPTLAYFDTQSWQGKDANAIINRLGNPTQIIHQPNGYTTYLYLFGYEYQPVQQFPGVGVNVDRYGKVVIIPPNMQAGMPQPNLKRCAITFLLDQKNKVIATQMEGSDCANKMPSS